MVISKVRCPQCGLRGMTPFHNETHTVEFQSHSVEVTGLHGWRCGACEEVVFDGPSAERYGEAGDTLILRERAEHEL